MIIRDILRLKNLHVRLSSSECRFKSRNSNKLSAINYRLFYVFSRCKMLNEIKTYTNF